MASKFETGHFINLSNFNSLISYLGTQPQYLPDATELSIASLSDRRDEVTDATNNLITQAAQLQQKVNDRQQTFAQIKKIAMRVMRYIEATSTDHEAIKDIKSHHNELKSKNVTKIETINPDGSVSTKTYSNNRLSYFSIAENFQKMVERIATLNNYAPTDSAISITALQNHYQNLHNINTQTNQAFQEVSIARINRDVSMYEKDIGLVDLAIRVKKFAQYKFGMQSDQYKYIQSLVFTKKQIRIQEPLPDSPPEIS